MDERKIDTINWPEIEEQGIVKRTRKYGKAQLYQINRENPVVIKLFEIEKVLIDKAAEEARKEEIENLVTSHERV